MCLVPSRSPRTARAESREPRAESREPGAGVRGPRAGSRPPPPRPSAPRLAPHLAYDTAREGPGAGGDHVVGVALELVLVVHHQLASGDVDELSAEDPDQVAR